MICSGENLWGNIYHAFEDCPIHSDKNQQWLKKSFFNFNIFCSILLFAEGQNSNGKERPLFLILISIILIQTYISFETFYLFYMTVTLFYGNKDHISFWIVVIYTIIKNVISVKNNFVFFFKKSPIPLDPPVIKIFNMIVL